MRMVGACVHGTMAALLCLAACAYHSVLTKVKWPMGLTSVLTDGLVGKAGETAGSSW